MYLFFTEDSIFSPKFKKSSPFIQRGHSVDTCPGSPVANKETNCQISVLLMIIHSGSVLGVYILLLCIYKLHLLVDGLIYLQ